MQDGEARCRGAAHRSVLVSQAPYQRNHRPALTPSDSPEQGCSRASIFPSAALKPRHGQAQHNIRAEKLRDELRKVGFETVDEWPGVFIKDAGTEHAVTVVTYVDDLLFTGKDTSGERGIRDVIRRVRKSINMEDPKDITK